jgi:hypothetical protein
LTEDYAIMDTTSIFARDRIAIDPNYIEVPQPPVIRQQVPRGEAPIFRGVMIDKDKGPVALVEMASQERGGTPTNDYLKPGDTIAWNGDKVVDVTMDGMLVLQGDTNVMIPIGHNVDNQQVSQLSTVAQYQSQDAMGVSNQQQQNYNGGGGGRGGRGGRGGGGGQGGGGGFGGGAGGLAGQIINVQLDPPLPPGSADDLEARMKARRDSQLNSTSSPLPAPTVAPTPAPAAAAGRGG